MPPSTMSVPVGDGGWGKWGATGPSARKRRLYNEGIAANGMQQDDPWRSKRVRTEHGVGPAAPSWMGQPAHGLAQPPAVTPSRKRAFGQVLSGPTDLWAKRPRTSAEQNPAAPREAAAAPVGFRGESSTALVPYSRPLGPEPPQEPKAVQFAISDRVMPKLLEDHKPSHTHGVWSGELAMVPYRGVRPGTPTPEVYFSGSNEARCEIVELDGDEGDDAGDHDVCMGGV